MADPNGVKIRRIWDDILLLLNLPLLAVPSEGKRRFIGRCRRGGAKWLVPIESAFP